MKQVYKIGSSEDLNPSQAVLLIEISQHHCGFAIVDYANFMMVESGYFQAVNKDHDEILQTLLDQQRQLKQSFRQTVIGFYTPENVLVPSRYYRYEESQNLLETMFEKDHQAVVSESVVEWQLFNTYHVPSSTHQLISRNFATGNFWHTYSIILKNPIEKKEGGCLLVDFKTDSFSLLATKNGTLLLAQIFPYATVADALYWILKSCQELSISQHDATLVISGLVDRESAMFKELYRYFVDVQFATLENDIQLSRDFEEFPVHFFSSFYKLATCVS